MTTRPLVMGTRHMASTGHYLASAAALRILDAGGNAIDAGVAAGVAINVVQSDLTNLGGVAPIVVWRADGRVETISGLGWWPKAADPELFRREHGGRIPKGVLRSIVPSAVDAWLTALERHGTMSFAEVAAPAIALAEDGFPMHHVMRDTVADPVALPSIREWPASREVFLGARGDPLPIGARVVQRDLARTLRRLVEAESGATSREAGLQGARDRFYRGDIAAEIARFVEAEGGWLSKDDLAEFRVGIEPPLRTSYRGYEVLACGPWCQGPVVLEALNILGGYDLAAGDRFSARTYHLIVEALKAAFADRERYYGDPRFVDVPIDRLLSREHAAAWRERIDPARAGDYLDEREPLAAVVSPDTSYVAIVDREGNAFSATPSDAAWDTPFIPGLGICASGRGTQSWVDPPDHPSALRPGKRPRLTPAPGLVLKDGQLFMAYGTPGLDMQPQAMVQMLVNVSDFGMDAQEAIEAPRAGSYSFPASSDPHPYEPGLLRLESRLNPSIGAALAKMGHRVEPWPDWARAAGSLSAVRVDRENGALHGAADPRRIGYAIGW